MRLLLSVLSRFCGVCVSESNAVPPKRSCATGVETALQRIGFQQVRLSRPTSPARNGRVDHPRLLANPIDDIFETNDEFGQSDCRNANYGRNQK